MALRTLTLFTLYSFPVTALTCSEKDQLSLVLSQVIVLSVVPFNVMPPPSAVASLGDVVDPSSIFLSSTVRVVLFTSVVWPLT